MELIDLAISNDLTQIVNFPNRIPDCDSHSPALLELFSSSDVSICSTMAFLPLRNSDHSSVSVSIDVPSNSDRGGPFYCIPSDCSCADWDSLRVYLRDVAWGDIFKLGASAAGGEFLERFYRLELMCISCIVNIRSSHIHLHGFRLLLLP